MKISFWKKQRVVYGARVFDDGKYSNTPLYKSALRIRLKSSMMAPEQEQDKFFSTAKIEQIPPPNRQRHL